MGFGEQTGGGNPGGVPPGGVPPGGVPPGGVPPGGVPPGEVPPGGVIPGGVPVFGNGLDAAYVAVTVNFDGKTWKQVGYRPKGNSTLNSLWGSGNYKLPFRLKFDKFEDMYYPGIKGQRFNGYKELSFSPGASDTSLIREKLAADIFRNSGVPAARTAFFRVYIDLGQGLKYTGLYTAIEVIEDTMLKDQYGSDSGNAYKPESTFATFKASQFDKKNNKDPANYSDVIAMIDVLNSAKRTSDPAQWRGALEAVFNVNSFIQWLAVNNAIVSWDSYGAMAHNHYLYNDPVKKLSWIPWDQNEALKGSPGINGTAGGTGGFTMGAQGLSLTMNEVGANWPLIRFLMDDPIYYARYKTVLHSLIETTFKAGDLETKIDTYHNLIAPYVVGPDGEQPGYTSTTDANFNASVLELKNHVRSRRSLLQAFVP